MARFVYILLFLEGLTETKALGWTCITSELPFFDTLHGMLCRISKEPAQHRMLPQSASIPLLQETYRSHFLSQCCLLACVQNVNGIDSEPCIVVVFWI